MNSEGFVSVQNAGQLRLRRVRIHSSLLGTPLAAPRDADGFFDTDIEISGGRVAAITAAGTFPEATTIDLRYGQAWPGFVDVHAHLDIGHTWPRAPNKNGTLDGALGATAMDHGRQWPVGDVRKRFEFGLRCAYAHGVTAIRTHIDLGPREAETRWAVFRELRDAWAGRVDLQAACLVPINMFGTEFGPVLADLVARSGGHLGAVTPVGDRYRGARGRSLQLMLDGMFALAEERGLDLDIHVDESGEDNVRALDHIARTALRRRFRNKILCGHCCSLANQSETAIRETLSACAEAGISVVSLPMSSMYLQDRAPGRTPRWRGVTVLHEMDAMGIPVAIGHDDCRNAFHCFGDQDMLEVFRMAVRIAHLDSPYGRWPQTVTRTPARIMNLEDRGTIAVGSPADLVLFKARTMSELLSRPQSDRVILRRGRTIDSSLPDYSELDEFQDEQAGTD